MTNLRFVENLFFHADCTQKEIHAYRSEIYIDCLHDLCGLLRFSFLHAAPNDVSARIDPEGPRARASLLRHDGEPIDDVIVARLESCAPEERWLVAPHADRADTVRAWIEDVVVDGAYRRQGIGNALVRAAIERAREAGARRVDLTSRPTREAANRLYRRLGFAQRETNVYRYTFEA